MKIAFDHTIFLIQKYGGISRYFLELHKKLQLKNNAKICCPIYINNFILNKKNVFKLFKLKNIPRYSTKLLNRSNYIFNEIYLNFWQPDIIHKTYFNDYKYSFKKAKKIINVWDLSHEIHHHMYDKPSDWRPKKKSLNNTDHIICSSKKTQSDLINFYNVDLNKTSVIYQGTPSLPETDLDLNIDFKFFLYVGSRKKYKNFKLVLKAFSSNKFFLENFCLICFGYEQFEKDEIELMNKLKINREKIKLFTGNDQILVSLYKNAEALIYPSLNEGFGFPTLEAMKFGCPIVASNNLAIQEAVGNCGFYFDPKDEKSLANSLEKLINSKDERELKRKDGFQRAKLFNWDNTSQDLLTLYKKILT
jgi:glycosyltransferase involved in cell wall biosynthesis